MDNIVEKIKEEMIQISNDKMEETSYDDWNNHTHHKIAKV